MARYAVATVAGLLVIAAVALGAWSLIHANQTAAELQRELATTVGASANTRVNTVQQRCDLTGLIIGFVRKADPSADISAFEASYAKCEQQLLTVKQIAAHAPTS